MAKKILILLLLFTNLLFSNEFNANPSLGFSGIAIKSFILKNPDELNPETCLIAGAVYQYGDESIEVSKDIQKAKQYYLSASKRGNITADLILGNIGLEEGNINEFVARSNKVMKAKNRSLSIPAGYQLSTLFMNLNRKKEAMRTLSYLADNYDEPRAQFLIGWALVYDGYSSDLYDTKDGEFYLYRACNNKKIDTKTIQQCKILNLNRK